MAADIKQPERQLDMKETKAKNGFLSKLKTFFKISIGILLLLCLIAGGFFLGIYLRVFDVNDVNQRLGLYSYPIIGQYFPKPADASGEPSEEAQTEPVKTVADVSEVKDPKAKPDSAVIQSKPVVSTKEEIEKQMQIRQAEEKKRIAKLARLYEQMKPKDAVAVMNDLNDDMVIEILGKMDEAQVAKILSEFDPGKSARITQIMYNGKPPVSQIQ